MDLLQKVKNNIGESVQDPELGKEILNTKSIIHKSESTGLRQNPNVLFCGRPC